MMILSFEWIADNNPTVRLDVSSFLFRDLDDVCWNAISDPHNPHKICGIRTVREDEEGGKLAHFLNGFVTSLPGDPFILNWQKILLSIWKDRVDSLNI